MDKKEKLKEYNRKRYLSKKESILQKNKEWRELNSDYYTKYRENNRDSISRNSEKYRNNNKIKCNKAVLSSMKKYPWITNAITAQYKASKLQATPIWSDRSKINIIYQKAKWLESITGLKYHVDHIIPLQGKDVCGLHVWYNLQILEASLNISKSNTIL